MKKLLMCLFAALCLTACGDDDEPKIEDKLDAEAASIAAHLNGTFEASWESLGSTQHEEFVFTPYAKPQKTDITIPGEYVNIDKTVTIFGSCVQTTYYNDHLLEVSKNYLYTVTVPYTGATPRLTVYTHTDGFIYGNYSVYDLRNVTSSAFEMSYDGSYRNFVKR
ncbi:MAG: hypothetical protein NC328_02480 [Muribaculum sp.]|nr:hypothetical protein [Muribaculum sp.]